jgi:PAS domain S-box-containing protein
MNHIHKEVRKEVNMSAFLKSMLENSRIASILILDKDGVILEISQGVKISYGYFPEEILGKNFSVLYSVEDQKNNKPGKELKEAFENGYAADNNYIMHKSNASIWSHGETIFVKNEEGDTFFIKFIYDINQQKLLERFLIASNRFSHSILETINEALIVLDENLNIIIANASFYRSFEIKKEDDIFKKSFFEISNESWNIPRLKELLYNVLPRNSSIKNFDVEFNFSSGKKIFRLNAQQVTEEGEKQQKILIAFDDVTRDEKAREDLSSKNLLLNKVNNDLDVFVYTASHDLKAPISNIEGLINAISEHPECSKGISELTQMMKESVYKFKNILEDLSKIVKVDQKENEGIVNIDFMTMLEEVKFNLHRQIEDADAFISEDFSQAPTINFSRKNLRSVLHNLLSNALKYRSPDRKSNICVSTEKTDGFILLKISDNGLGIKEEDKEKVLAIFERIHKHIEGTGVGLNIVKKIIDNNGGRIQIESKVGEGTTFLVYFKV